jgi:hypothetical protein
MAQVGEKRMWVLVGKSENKGLIGRCKNNIKSGIM